MPARRRFRILFSRTAAGLVRALLLASLWLTGSDRPGLAADVSGLYAAKSPSVVTVTSNGRPAGTGFFVAPHIIATCQHVVGKAVNLGYAEHYRNGIHPVTRLVAVDAEHDLVLLYAEKAGTALTVVLPNTLTPGAEVATIGSPLGFEKSIALGNFNNLRNDGKTEYLQVSTPASHGSSGSPLFTAKGQVVGIMQQAVKPQYGQNLNFAISSKYLLALLATVDGKTPADYRPLPARPLRTAQDGSGKNFGNYYAWIDNRGVYCFTATPPPSRSLGRLLSRKELLETPVSYMWSTARPDTAPLPSQNAAP